MAESWREVQRFSVGSSCLLGDIAGKVLKTIVWAFLLCSSVVYVQAQDFGEMTFAGITGKFKLSPPGTRYTNTTPGYGNPNGPELGTLTRSSTVWDPQKGVFSQKDEVYHIYRNDSNAAKPWLRCSREHCGAIEDPTELKFVKELYQKQEAERERERKKQDEEKRRNSEGNDPNRHQKEQNSDEKKCPECSAPMSGDTCQVCGYPHTAEPPVPGDAPIQPPLPPVPGGGGGGGGGGFGGGLMSMLPQLMQQLMQNRGNQPQQPGEPTLAANDPALIAAVQTYVAVATAQAATATAAAQQVPGTPAATPMATPTAGYKF